MAQAPRSKTNESREDRLKASLKANMAKRKAQAKARAGQHVAPEAKTDTGKDRQDG